MQFIQTQAAPQAIGPYSQGTQAGNLIFVSGQLPLKDGTLIEDPSLATSVALNNVLAIIEAAGASKNNITKVSIFVRDLNDFDTINVAYTAFFGNHRPARALVQVARIPKDAVLEIEAIAVTE